MKTVFNFTFGRWLLTLAAIAWPLGAGAVVIAAPASEQAACAALSQVSIRINQQLTARLSNFDSSQSAQRQDLEAQRQRLEAQLKSQQGQQDSNMTQHFRSLQGKAATDAQKRAVSVFQDKVTAATAAHRVAIQQVTKSLNQAAVQTLSSHQAGVKQAVDSFTSALKAALSRASSSCNGSNLSSVIANLQQDIRTASASLNSALQAINQKNPTSSQALSPEQKAAIEKANADLRAALSQARDELKAALSQD